jgi:putative colanic acid biosynthesis acetyltransferase WcaF
LRIFGASVGAGVVIKPRVNIKYPWFLEIGDNVWIGEDVWIDNLASVVIGNNVCISQGAYLLTGNHDYKDKYFGLVTAGITVHDGAWIGARCLVCPGADIAEHVVLTVCSVLSAQHTEPYGIYQGNPARLVKQREIG